MRIFKACAVLIMIAVFPAMAGGSGNIDNDSLRFTHRAFDSTLLDNLKHNPDLSYPVGPSGLSLWERLKLLIGQVLGRLLNLAGSTNWTKVITVMIAVAILAYVILRLFKIDALGFFHSRRKTGGILPSPDEDIHLMNFELLIQTALGNGDYRSATRLRFLQALRLLSENNYLKWHPGKTNYDYQLELASSGFGLPFNRLSRYFEYAWYGNFSINADMYSKVDSVFQELTQGIH